MTASTNRRRGGGGGESTVRAVEYAGESEKPSSAGCFLNFDIGEREILIAKIIYVTSRTQEAT